MGPSSVVAACNVTIALSKALAFASVHSHEKPKRDESAQLRLTHGGSWLSWEADPVRGTFEIRLTDAPIGAPTGSAATAYIVRRFDFARGTSGGSDMRAHRLSADTRDLFAELADRIIAATE